MTVAYFQGRPHGHPTHSLYAKSVGADFFFFDKYLPYHVKSNPFKPIVYLSWFLTAFLFPKRRYNFFLSEEPYFFLALMNYLHLISKRKKVISIMGTHTLYFIKEKKLSPNVIKLMLWIFSNYDGIICQGDMQKEMFEEFLHPFKRKPKVISITNGSTSKRIKALMSISREFGVYKMVTIAQVSDKKRAYYKGIDLMFRAFNIAGKKHPQLRYDIIGFVAPEIQEDLLKLVDKELFNRISFLGRIENYEEAISGYDLCLHTARGEAWGISINECLLGGLPTIVSEWTGAKEIIAKIDPSMITILDDNEIAHKIENYYSQSIEKLNNISFKCRSISATFTEKRSVEEFKNAFTELT